MRRLLTAVLLLSCATTEPDPDPRPRAFADDLNVLGEVSEDDLSDLARKIQRAEPGDFPLYFNSPGGSVFDGLDFLRTMEAAQRRGVRFVCTADLAASMGAVLFSACDIRLALPRAMILIHTASVGDRGNARDHRETAEDLEAISDAMLRQIHRTFLPHSMSFEELKARTDGRDFWLDAGRAELLGLVQSTLP